MKCFGDICLLCPDRTACKVVGSQPVILNFPVNDEGVEQWVRDGLLPENHPCFREEITFN